MLKTISKFVLVAAIAATAVSFSTPSYAAKKKKAAAPAACTAWQYKSAGCNNVGVVRDAKVRTGRQVVSFADDLLATGLPEVATPPFTRQRAPLRTSGAFFLPFVLVSTFRR